MSEAEQVKKYTLSPADVVAIKLEVIRKNSYTSCFDYSPIHTVKYFGWKYIRGVRNVVLNEMLRTYRSSSSYSSGLYFVRVCKKEIFALVVSVDAYSSNVIIGFPTWNHIPLLLKYYKDPIGRFLARRAEVRQG